MSSQGHEVYNVYINTVLYARTRAHTHTHARTHTHTGYSIMLCKKLLCVTLGF